jgi:hypothetical protein
MGVAQIARSSGTLVYPQSHVASTSDLTLYESSFQNFGFYTREDTGSSTRIPE